MSAALKAGYSVENALRETYSDLKSLYKKDSRILKEYEQMIYKLNINRTAEQVLEEFSDSTKFYYCIYSRKEKWRRQHCDHI